MNRKTITILLLVLAVLIIASLTQKSNHDKTVTQSDSADLFSTDFGVENIGRIVITQGADTTGVILENPGKWVVRTRFSHAADSKKVEQLLVTLNELSGQFRSDNSDVLTDYGLGSKDAVKVTLFGTDFEVKNEIEIGKTPAGGSGHFIRLTDNNKVYHTKSALLSKMGLFSGPELPKHAFFLDNKVFSTVKEDIRAITLFQDDEVIELVKRYAVTDSVTDYSSWNWEMTQPQKVMASNTSADQLMNGFININSADVADPESDLMGIGLWKADKRAVVNLADGTEFELRVGNTTKENGDEYYAMTGDSNTIRIIKKYKVDQIFKSSEDLLPE